MGDFKKFGGPRSKHGFKKQGFGGRPEFRSERRMFAAVCDSCHQSCEVPFRPTGDRPVYCSNCFQQKNGGAHNDFPKKRSFEDIPTRNFTPEIIKAQPQADKRIDEIKAQLNVLNTKLDQIIAMAQPAPVEIAPVASAKIAEPKLEKKGSKAVKAVKAAKPAPKKSVKPAATKKKKS